MNSSSIRFRISALAAVSVAVVLVLASIGLVAVHRRQLTSNVDLALAQRAQDLTAFVETTDLTAVELSATQQEGFAQLLSADGLVVAFSPNLAGAPPLPIDYAAGTPQTVRTLTGLAVDDDVFRVLSRTVQTASGPGVLHVGTTLDDVAENTAVLAGTLLVSIPVVVVLLAGMVWWLVGAPSNLSRTCEPKLRRLAPPTSIEEFRSPEPRTKSADWPKP
ncbi:MAG: hypothetical protein JJE47_04265 [Acidimicrobiia bacterium]|nr:hypothetical protein [Acidimicrobiia bacterium]